MKKSIKLTTIFTCLVAFFASLIVSLSFLITPVQGKIYVEWKCDKDRYHITVRADEEVGFYYDFKDREVLSLEMRESILNAVIK